jgi:hypothetical protein
VLAYICYLQNGSYWFLQLVVSALDDKLQLGVAINMAVPDNRRYKDVGLLYKLSDVKYSGVFHICLVKTQQTVCQIVSLCIIQLYVIYNYKFRPCKTAIIRLDWTIQYPIA